ncbi:hypothetical protein [Streptomyces sp. AM8-1-1]|uniref:hypothetical protein n=1 Tax=Streptomyces sp. AM8-1-1 TaxID=3075825 RepID=UPI0028C3F943|nr:hypothetical protein [Streptomyces sp. AM8-1-1]WNO72196.1 hypothetical protein RPQ07_11425 [Streptomyces sp. AM8-1-1]
MTNYETDGGRPRRSVDRGARIEAYADLIHVVCPGCGGRADVVPRPGLPELKYHTELLFRPRRLACGRCATVRDWEAECRGGALIAATLGGPDEPFFGQPLWLRTPCRGKVLWAYNEHHIDALEHYLAAGLRERDGHPHMSMLTRLPAWMKAAGHRDDVLRGLSRMRELLHADAPADRPSSAVASGPGRLARPVRASWSPPY